MSSTNKNSNQDVTDGRENAPDCVRYVPLSQLKVSFCLLDVNRGLKYDADVWFSS
jgi:hypothetical protein